MACSYDTLNGSYSSGLMIHHITFGKIILCLAYNLWYVYRIEKLMGFCTLFLVTYSIFSPYFSRTSKYFSKFKEMNRRCFCTPFDFIGGFDPRTSEHNCEFRVKGFARTWMDDPVIVSTGAYLLGAICTFMITDYGHDSNDSTDISNIDTNCKLERSGAKSLFLSFYYLTFLQIAAFFASLLYHRCREISYINLDMPIALSLLFICMHSFVHALFLCFNQTVKYWKESENCEEHIDSWMNKARYNNCLQKERQKTMNYLHLVAPAVVFIALLSMGLIMAGYLFKSCGLPGKGYWIAEKREEDSNITNSNSNFFVNTGKGFVRESLTDTYDALHTYWHLLSGIGPLLCCMYWNHIYSTVALEMDTSIQSLVIPWIGDSSSSSSSSSGHGKEVLGMGFLDEAELLPSMPVFAIAAALAMNVALNIAGELPFD